MRILIRTQILLMLISCMIVLENIKKSYFLEDIEYPIIQNVNLSIAEGEFVTIIGPSGSGKSTLMNIL